MPIYKNKASQKLAVVAIDTSDGSLKTGDAANITAQISKDGGVNAATNDANPAELDSTNHPGVYIFDLLQAETNANLITLTADSTTNNISLGDPQNIFTQDMPLDEANTELANVPASTAGIRAMIQHLFEKVRHKETFNKDTGISTLYKDDGLTSLGTSTSTDDGTVVTRGEMT